ncbi:MAG: methionyl-tRNA formyltransferase [Patescibacteria group bacterium]|jgi:methionyl-tRNA formyltransferase
MEYAYISSGSFGAQVLQHLDPKPSLVITGIDKLGGRGMKELIQTPVKKLCTELHIPYKEVADKIELAKIVRSDDERQREGATKQLAKRLLLLCDFGVIVPSELLHLNEYGIWNIHPSLLPKHRGTTPIQTALLNGEKVTGVTIMQIDEKIDHGPIIAQERTEIDINDTNVTLQAKLAEVGATLVNSKWLRVNGSSETLRPLDIQTLRPQDHSQATFTKKLTKEDGFVPLNELAPYLEPILKKYNLMHLLPTGSEIRDARYADVLHNKIRAFTPWPGVWTKLADESVLKIVSSTFEESEKIFVITEVERNGKKYGCK